MLYVVSTPIGNLSDISERMKSVLSAVDIIASEDTRRTGRLLKHMGIEAKQISYNDHNKERKTPYLIDELKAEKDIALVSDCGTPGISDPGFYLIRQAIAQGISVSPIPGPTAVISALVGSGLPTDSFSFYGFLSKKKKARTDFFEAIKGRKETIICFDSPHRIESTLGILSEILPDASVCVARELTKKFEEFIRGSSAEVYEAVKNKPLKGEIVLLVSAK